MLKIGKLDAADVGVGTINDLRDCIACIRPGGGCERTCVVNRIDELFVEEASLNDTVGLQVVLVEQIKIVGVFGFQIRIAESDVKGVCGLIEDNLRTKSYGLGRERPLPYTARISELASMA